MDNKIVFEAMNTGVRNDLRSYYRELILLYEDGTWEKIFRSELPCNIACIGAGHLRGATRYQVVAKLEGLIHSGKLKGEFLNKNVGES